MREQILHQFFVCAIGCNERREEWHFFLERQIDRIGKWLVKRNSLR